MKYYLTIIQAYEKESDTEVHCFVLAFSFCIFAAYAGAGRKREADHDGV